MADRYYRLVSFVVNICPEPLRKLFVMLAEADSTPKYTTLDTYLAFKKPCVNKLKSKKKIRKDQYDLLYPSNGSADQSKWDVTLLVTLVTELFPTCLRPVDKFLMEKEIRGIRNELQHLSNTSEISENDFDSYWDRLKTAATSLAKQVLTTQTEIDEFNNKIEDTKTNHLPDLGDCLRFWYEEIIKQMTNKMDEMSDTISDMKQKLDKVEKDSAETSTILRNVTIQKPGPSGKGNKRQRIMVADGILAHLQASFETRIKELPDNFNAPAEVEDIRTRLRDKHYVVVTGSYNSRYFEAALDAVNGMGYNRKRCVEMQNSSDWRHIDPEDVDFVLCSDPFGTIAFDESKTKGMADIFNSMKHTVDGDSGKTIDIMVVTDYGILMECKQRHDHDMLDEVVKVFGATTADTPADLTSMCNSRQNISSSQSMMTHTLRVMTDHFLRQYSDASVPVDKDLLKDARSIFKAKKAVVIAGTYSTGKTSTAVALASSYQPSQCLLLTRPNDVKLIDFQNICLVIIDEFTGKYRYEINQVYKWLDMFDHLHAAVSAGHLNIIITCEISKLKRCRRISKHPLLENMVETKERSFNIKQELADTESVAVSEASEKSSEFTSYTSIHDGQPDPLQRLGYDQQKDTARWISHEVVPYGFITTSNTRKLRKQIPKHKIRGAARNPFRSLTVPQEIDTGKTSMAQESSKTPSLLRKSNKWAESGEKRVYNIKTPGDLYDCDIRGCCQLPSREVLLADWKNKHLKKLNPRYQVIGVCGLPGNPWDVCYLGNNEAVVSLHKQLQYINVVTMATTTLIDTEHLCVGLACHGNKLYVSEYNTIYLYSSDGVKQRVFKTDLGSVGLLHVTVSDSGRTIHYTKQHKLITLDHSGKRFWTTTESELGISRAVCVDDDSHAFVCDRNTGSINLIMSLGRLSFAASVVKATGITSLHALCFDRNKDVLTCAGTSNEVTVFQLKRCKILRKRIKSTYSDDIWVQ